MTWRVIVVMSIAAALAAGTPVAVGADEMVPVAGGSFLMGDPAGADVTAQPAHEVKLKDFYLARREISQREWMEIMGDHPFSRRGEYLPADCISWYDAIEFCNAKSVKEGRRVVYRVDRVRRDSNNLSILDDKGWVVEADWSADGYRLPTEAEWEYAARKYQEGKLDVSMLQRTMREWCWDWYGRYEGVAVADPTGPARGNQRVWRGGNWDDPPSFDRPTFRGHDDPSARFFVYGLRLATSCR